ncbi:glycosyltransferase family 2 protein [Williamsia sp. MIQD14]|uniref:glycosyltransferase family 2 protein n=1 Tax=Williamsia sp. MIQD14 TaxID=3425703 RepID=UPI003DA189E4
MICPTFNRSTAIVDTVESVRGQHHHDWELIVVSDASTDDTDSVVAALAADDDRIRLVRTDRRHGQPATPRNVGLAHVRGDIVAYLDHDDLMVPDHLATVAGMIDDGAEIVATGATTRDPTRRMTTRTRAAHLFWHPEIAVLGPTFEPSRVAHRTGLVERVGGWRPGPGLEDWDLWVRVSDAGVGFTTTTAPTVELLADAATRRHRMACRFHVAVATFDTARDAAQALSRLRADDDAERHRAALVADIVDWYRPMTRSAAFVTPSGWSGDPVDEVVDSLGTPRPWSDLVVVRGDRGFAVARPVACHTAAHASRIQALADRIRRRQTALARSVIGADRP